MELTDKHADKIILIPYAEKIGANTGVNISNKHKRQEVYMKNCCVSACSAKQSNADCDVAIVTNITFPDSYARILKSYGVGIIHIPFDKFYFGDAYTWSLAFYKLCAIYHVVREYDYQYYAYVDADVYVQSSFSDIWMECDENILLYDICHGIQVKDYRIFLSEVASYCGQSNFITHYGGEFFAATYANAMLFTEQCEKIYREMIERNVQTTKGDEFIVSLAAMNLRNKVKNAGAYIYRFWTGSFNLTSTCYRFNPVAILHVPAEKESGAIKLFDHYYSKGKTPTNNKVHKMLHLKKPALVPSVTLRIKAIIKYLVRR